MSPECLLLLQEEDLLCFVQEEILLLAQEEDLLLVKKQDKEWSPEKSKMVKKHFFPDILANSAIAEHSITTVNQSVSNGARSYTTLVDMEASAIYQACIKRVETHQISFLKIVSEASYAVKLRIGVIILINDCVI